MTVIEVATANVRPDPVFQGNGVGLFACAAHYVHPEEGEVWVSVGAGATEEDARLDLTLLLQAEGVEAPIELSECLDKRQRRRLIWSVIAQAMMYHGVALAVEG